MEVYDQLRFSNTDKSSSSESENASSMPEVKVWLEITEMYLVQLSLNTQEGRTGYSSRRPHQVKGLPNKEASECKSNSFPIIKMHVSGENIDEWFSHISDFISSSNNRKRDALTF